MNFHSLKISTKLIFGFLLISILNVSVVIYAIVELSEDGELINKMYEHPYRVNNEVRDISKQLLNVNKKINLLLLYKDDYDLMTIKKEVQDNYIQMEQKFQIVYKSYLGKKSDIDKAYKLYKEEYALEMLCFDMLQKNNILQAMKCMNKDEDVIFSALEKQLSSIADFSHTNATSYIFNAQEHEKNAKKYIYLILFFTIILNLLIARYTIIGISIPLQELIYLNKKIIDGELSLTNSKEVQKFLHREDEIGKLFQTFNTIMTALLLPYKDIITTHGNLVEKTYEVQRLLHAFDHYVIACKTDTRGIIIYVSSAFQRATGYSKKELLGNTHQVINHPDMPHSLFKNLWQTISKGEKWQGEIKDLRKDGTAFWISTNIQEDINAKGERIGYNSISEDITSLKNYEELSKTLDIRVKDEIMKNEERTLQLVQQSRLAQMGEMISMIAHQWRQPLSSISAISATLSLDIMLNNYNEEFFKNRLDAIDELAQHLSHTIDDFRGFFQEKTEKKSVKVSELVRNCLTIIEPSLKNHNINLDIEINESLEVESYANELKQVMLNIFKNAEDALLDLNIQSATISARSYQKNSNVYIEIEDNAGGIAKDIIDKIFDPYFSTKKQKDGTGLGLYMSRIIMQEHIGGKILVKNSNEGACFSLVIPVKNDDTTLEGEKA